MAVYLLRDATLYDGTGGPAVQGDLLIQDKRIAAIGRDLPRPPEAEEIDCGGLCVAPGFIDAHSHNDFFADRGTEYFAPFVEQGITTQVVGNCGFSPFGFEENTPFRELIGSGLFTMDIKGDYADLEGFAALNHNIPVNLVPLLGHGTVRIGLSGHESRALSTEERSRLLGKVDACLRQGAFGVSLGLMYEPGRYTPFEELKAVAQAVKAHDKVLTVHARACSAVSTSYGLPFGGEAHNLRALREAVELCTQTGVKLQFSHLIFVGKRSFATVDACMRLIDQTRDAGFPLMFDMYAGTFGASVITVILPTWYLALPEERRRSPLVKARLAMEINLSKKLLGFDFSDIRIAYIGPRHPDYEGRTVAQIARDEGAGELATYLKLVRISGEKGHVLMDRYYNQEIIERLAAHPGVLYMTDAWIQSAGVQNAAAFGTFPRFLQLSRDGRIGPLPQTIRRMTGATADRFGLVDRGYLRKGAFADVTCFNLQKIHGNVKECEPPRGIAHVFINGVPVLRDGKPTGALEKRPGRMLRAQESK